MYEVPGRKISQPAQVGPQIGKQQFLTATLQYHAFCLSPHIRLMPITSVCSFIPYTKHYKCVRSNESHPKGPTSDKTDGWERQSEWARKREKRTK